MIDVVNIALIQSERIRHVSIKFVTLHKFWQNIVLNKLMELLQIMRGMQ